eukprot:scaffold246842_cov13-Tisochrysis_lutea.AAC.1
MLMKSVLTGAVPGAWMGAADKQLLSAAHITTYSVILHQKSPKLGIPDKKICWFCVPSFRAD